MPRAYTPSGKSDSGALPIVFGASLAAAVVGGLVEGFLAQWFNLLLIFPAALGLLAGGVGVTQAKARNLRNPLAALLIGVIAGLAAQAIVHGMGYQRARAAIAESIEKDSGAAEFVRQQGINGAVDAVLMSEGGATPLLGYLDLAAKQGITITRAGGSSSGPTLTGAGAYALWAINFLIAAGIAAWMIASQAREPFCERCNTWYETEAAIAAGAGDPSAVKATVQRLKDGRLAEAIREIGRSDGKSAALLVLRGCPACKDHDPLLEVRRVVGIGAKQEIKHAYAALISPSEAQELIAARPTADKAAA